MSPTGPASRMIELTASATAAVSAATLARSASAVDQRHERMVLVVDSATCGRPQLAASNVPWARPADEPAGRTRPLPAKIPTEHRVRHRRVLPSDPQLARRHVDEDGAGLRCPGAGPVDPAPRRRWAGRADRHPRIRRLVQPPGGSTKPAATSHRRTRDRLPRSEHRPRRGRSLSKMSLRTHLADSLRLEVFVREC